jgi:hypothetical protein
MGRVSAEFQDGDQPLGKGYHRRRELMYKWRLTADTATICEGLSRPRVAPGLPFATSQDSAGARYMRGTLRSVNRERRWMTGYAVRKGTYEDIGRRRERRKWYRRDGKNQNSLLLTLYLRTSRMSIHPVRLPQAGIWR